MQTTEYLPTFHYLVTKNALPHECSCNLEIFGLCDITEHKLSNGTDEDGEDDPVGVHS